MLLETGVGTNVGSYNNSGKVSGSCGNDGRYIMLMMIISSDDV